MNDTKMVDILIRKGSLVMMIISLLLHNLKGQWFEFLLFTYSKEWKTKRDYDLSNNYH